MSTQVVIQLIGAFFSVYSAAMIFDAPPKVRPICGTVAVASWAVYLIIRPLYGEMSAVYLSALFISVIAQILARKARMPVTVAMLPSLFLLVPGLPLYRAVYNLINSQSKEFDYHMRLTFITAGMIALAIFTADFLITSYYRLKHYLHKNKAKTLDITK